MAHENGLKMRLTIDTLSSYMLKMKLTTATLSSYMYIRRTKHKCYTSGNVNEIPLTKCQALTTTYQDVGSSILFIRACDQFSLFDSHNNLH